MTYDEVQALFDAADGLAEEIRVRGRKGSLGAQRDAAVLKTIYAYGLRRREAWGLDVADLRHNPKIPEFGRYGGLFVRWGKSSRGSAPKRRTVLTVPGASPRSLPGPPTLADAHPENLSVGHGQSRGLWRVSNSRPQIAFGIDV